MYDRAWSFETGSCEFHVVSQLDRLELLEIVRASARVMTNEISIKWENAKAFRILVQYFGASET